MDELTDFDWSYTIPDKPNFISDLKCLDTSAIHKITQDIFVDPLICTSDEEQQSSRPENFKQKKTSNLKGEKIKLNKTNIHGFRRLANLPHKSCLDTEEHKLGAQIIRYFNNQITSIPPINIDPLEIQKYEALRRQIQAERNLFYQFAKTEWENNLCKRVVNTNTNIDKFAEHVWNEKVKKIKVYPQFYKTVGTLPLVYMNEKNPIEMTLVQTLETVNMDQLSVVNFNKPPKLKDKFNAVYKYYTLYKNFHGEKCLISADRKGEQFAQSLNADIVISLSSLKKLSDTYPPYNKSWVLPILIQKYQTKNSCNKTVDHNIIYIDQPLPDMKSNCLEKTKWYYKKLMKLKMLKNHFRNCEKTDNTASQNESTNSNETESKDNSDSDEDDDDKLYIDVENASLIDGVQTVEKDHPKITQSISPEKDERKKYTYRLWKIGQSIDEKLSKSTEKPLNILIRCKSQAKEIDNKTEREVILMPKIEHQYDYGMEAITSSEAAVNWTNLYFRPNSQLLRARIYPNSGESVLVEKIPLQVLQTEAKNFTIWKSQMALGCYFNIFNVLKKYSPGQYLLKHDAKHHAFAILYEATQIKDDTSYDMYESYNVKYDQTILYPKIPWTPLDPNVIHPNLYYQGRMPCMFTPIIKRKHSKKVSDKNKIKKKKFKKTRVKRKIR